SWGLPSLEELGLLNEEGEAASFWVSLLACVYDGAIFSPGVIVNNLWNEIIVGNLFGLIASRIELIPSDWVVAFLNDGVLEGLAAVLSFLPQILVLFLFFSILEDSGYMARVAFILDRIFRRFGLSGRAFMPMIMGFGCSIPAMVNTRTLADDKERTATIRVIPFFSCGAKLPILTAIAGGILAFFGFGNIDLITYLMYIGGIAAAIIAVIIMRGTTMKGEVPPFIMELPAYHVPGFKNLMLHLWEKCKHFVKKAFTIILASTIVIWFLSSFGWAFWNGMVEDMDQSILASIGKVLQPLFTPLGFGAQLNSYGWVFAVAVITGLIAKENVVSTFASLAAAVMAGISVSSPEILEELEVMAEGSEAAWTMIAATGIGVPALLSFIMFNMTTIPCFAACATANAELPKGKFWLTVLFWLLTSYATGIAFYLGGLLAEAIFGACTASIVMGVVFAILIGAVVTAIVMLIARAAGNRKGKKVVEAR
ncbi:MAG: nucleoside recognition domain-containing protein, partial [Christensenellaceae bacterium]